MRNINIAELEDMTLTDLRDMARDAEVPGFSRLKKQDLMLELLRPPAPQTAGLDA